MAGRTRRKGKHTHESASSITAGAGFPRVGIARDELRTRTEHGRGRGPAANSSKNSTADGTPRGGSGLPDRGPVAVPRFLAGSVASFWIMLKEPLVPLTRKEGLRCSRARDISMEVWKPKNGKKERRYGSFATTSLMLRANDSAGPSWSEHGRSIQPNPPPERHRSYKRSCYGLTRNSRLRPVPPILER